ncbi:hypothetical protein NDU88_005858 [Pleurodeles waltl]|uniref:Uncharacterized protein n=1 Tax=Pleurodeles waltl TaxID=8319 RepID=A0AAV7PGW2_PLEWA|nr:hypothetical protein NDU88_005858 [Pleurodeles waltl]
MLTSSGDFCSERRTSTDYNLRAASLYTRTEQSEDELCFLRLINTVKAARPADPAELRGYSLFHASRAKVEYTDEKALRGLR